MNQKIWAYLIYTVTMQSLLWIPVSVAVFFRDYSGWWMAMPILLCTFQYRPARFGIRELPECQ